MDTVAIRVRPEPALAVVVPAVGAKAGLRRRDGPQHPVGHKALMRWALAAVLALWLPPASAATLDIQVYDAFGASYRTTRIGEQLGAIYNISFEPRLVLILGPSLSDERVRRQERIAAGIDPDEHGILFAVGTPDEQTYGRGFSLAPNTAAGLLPSVNAFRVIVLGASGQVLLDVDEVVPRERLVELSQGS